MASPLRMLSTTSQGKRPPKGGRTLAGWVRNGSRWRRLAIVVSGLGALVLSILLGIGIAGRDGNEAPPDTEGRYVSVAVDGRLVPGSRFEVEYAARNAEDVDELRPTLATGLRRNGTPLATLTAEVGGYPARVVPAGEPITLPGVDLLGGGRFTFTLPHDLRAGRYQLCGVVGVQRPNKTRPFRDSYCKSITVSAG